MWAREAWLSPEAWLKSTPVCRRACRSPLQQASTAFCSGVIVQGEWHPVHLDTSNGGREGGRGKKRVKPPLTIEHYQLALSYFSGELVLNCIIRMYISGV